MVFICLFIKFRIETKRDLQIREKRTKMCLKFTGIVVGLGVGMTRDCSILMIAQYFKKKREFVEMLTVAGSGLGIVYMSTFMKKSIDSFGWR